MTEFLFGKVDSEENWVMIFNASGFLQLFAFKHPGKVHIVKLQGRVFVCFIDFKKPMTR